jgi:hypothetical protein
MLDLISKITRVSGSSGRGTCSASLEFKPKYRKKKETNEKLKLICP